MSRWGDTGRPTLVDFKAIVANLTTRGPEDLFEAGSQPVVCQIIAAHEISTQIEGANQLIAVTGSVWALNEYVRRRLIGDEQAEVDFPPQLRVKMQQILDAFFQVDIGDEPNSELLMVHDYVRRTYVQFLQTFLTEGQFTPLSDAWIERSSIEAVVERVVFVEPEITSEDEFVLSNHATLDTLFQRYYGGESEKRLLGEWAVRRLEYYHALLQRGDLETANRQFTRNDRAAMWSMINDFARSYQPKPFSRASPVESDVKDDSETYRVTARAVKVLSWFNEDGSFRIPDGYLVCGTRVSTIWNHPELFGFETQEAFLLSDSLAVCEHLNEPHYAACAYDVDKEAIVSAIILRIERLNVTGVTLKNYFSVLLEHVKDRPIEAVLDSQKNTIIRLALAHGKHGLFDVSMAVYVLEKHRQHRISNTESPFNEFIDQAFQLAMSLSRWAGYENNTHQQLTLAAEEVVTWYETSPVRFSFVPQHWLLSGVSYEQVFQRQVTYQYDDSVVEFMKSDDATIYYFVDFDRLKTQASRYDLEKLVLLINFRLGVFKDILFFGGGEQAAYQRFSREHVSEMVKILNYYCTLPDCDPVLAMEASTLIDWVNVEGNLQFPQSFLEKDAFLGAIWGNPQPFGFETFEALACSNHPVMVTHLHKEKYHHVAEGHYRGASENNKIMLVRALCLRCANDIETADTIEILTLFATEFGLDRLFDLGGFPFQLKLIELSQRHPELEAWACQAALNCLNHYVDHHKHNKAAQLQVPYEALGRTHALFDRYQQQPTVGEGDEILSQYNACCEWLGGDGRGEYELCPEHWAERQTLDVIWQRAIEVKYAGNVTRFQLSKDVVCSRYLNLDTYRGRVNVDDRLALMQVIVLRLENYLRIVFDAGLKVAQKTYVDRAIELMAEAMFVFHDDFEANVYGDSVVLPVASRLHDSAMTLSEWFCVNTGAFRCPDRYLTATVNVCDIWEKRSYFGYDRDEAGFRLFCYSEHETLVSHLQLDRYLMTSRTPQEKHMMAQAAFIRLEGNFRTLTNPPRRELVELLRDYCSHFPVEESVPRYRTLLYNLTTGGLYDPLPDRWRKMISGQHDFDPIFYLSPRLDADLEPNGFLDHSDYAKQCILRAVMFRLHGLRFAKTPGAQEQLEKYSAILQLADTHQISFEGQDQVPHLLKSCEALERQLSNTIRLWRFAGNPLRFLRSDFCGEGNDITYAEGVSFREVFLQSKPKSTMVQRLTEEVFLAEYSFSKRQGLAAVAFKYLSTQDCGSPEQRASFYSILVIYCSLYRYDNPENLTYVDLLRNLDAHFMIDTLPLRWEALMSEYQDYGPSFFLNTQLDADVNFPRFEQASIDARHYLVLAALSRLQYICYVDHAAYPESKTRSDYVAIVVSGRFLLRDYPQLMGEVEWLLAHFWRGDQPVPISRHDLIEEDVEVQGAEQIGLDESDDETWSFRGYFEPMAVQCAESVFYAGPPMYVTPHAVVDERIDIDHVTLDAYYQASEEARHLIGHRALGLYDDYVSNCQRLLKTKFPESFTAPPFPRDVYMVLRAYFGDIRYQRQEGCDFGYGKRAKHCFKLLRWLNSDGCFDGFFLLYEESVLQRYNHETDTFYVNSDNTYWKKLLSTTKAPSVITSQLTPERMRACSFVSALTMVRAAICLLESRRSYSFDGELIGRLIGILKQFIGNPLWCCEIDCELECRIYRILEGPDFSHPERYAESVADAIDELAEPGQLNFSRIENVALVFDYFSHIPTERRTISDDALLMTLLAPHNQEALLACQPQLKAIVVQGDDEVLYREQIEFMSRLRHFDSAFKRQQVDGITRLCDQSGTALRSMAMLLRHEYMWILRASFYHDINRMSELDGLFFRVLRKLEVFETAQDQVSAVETLQTMFSHRPRNEVLRFSDATDMESVATV